MNDLNGYIKNTSVIRRLSSPALNDIEDDARYSSVLRDNFTRIGRIAGENREILDTCFYPYIGEHRELTAEELEAFGEFGDSLLDAYNLENIDPAIYSILTAAILPRVEDMASDALLITWLDREIMACYTMANMTGRLCGHGEIAERYRERGFRAGRKLLRYLEPAAFAKLTDEERGLVLINSRYLWVLYEGACLTEEEARENYEQLERTLLLADDPAYTDVFPEYDWKNHVFRTLYYMAITIENHNQRGMPPDVLKRICARITEMDRLYHTDEYFRKLADEREMELLLLRARYESGGLGRAAYAEGLLSLYERRDIDNYELSGMIANLNIPAEYLILIDPGKISEAESRQIRAMYYDVINYAFHMPENGSLSYMLEYVSAIFRNFIELPDGISFEEMCLNCLAALHPPTYVHSVMVAEITRCLTEHMIDAHPECFLGMPEAEDREALLSYAYHAALCHDIGKIMMIDTIFVYGRTLLDEEYSIIRMHPDVGAELLSMHDETKRYASAARAHHLSYDLSAGYPSDFDPSELPEKPVIDIISCADSLDAATDSVGRSYRRGKSLEEFTKELSAGSGTRYSPLVAELFETEDVREELRAILAGDREKNYRKTYGILKDLHLQGNRGR